MKHSDSARSVKEQDKSRGLALHWQVLIALPLAVVAGILVGPDAQVGGVTFVAVFGFVGTLFLNALKMLVVPLVAASIITGILSIGTGSHLGRLGFKTILYYLSTSLLAILVGLMFVNALAPGLEDGRPIEELRDSAVDTSAVTEKVEGKGASDVVDVFLRMVPTNPVAAAVEGDMLGLIFFSLLFGFFMAKIKEPQGSTLRQFWQGVFDIMMLMAHWVMKFTPYGVFALVGKVFATTGFAAFKPLALFFATVLLALLTHFLIVLPLLLRFIGGVNPLRQYRAMAPALLTAFSTSSSSATLPVTIECVEGNAKVSNRTSSFVLPLGATINMDGTALYECVAAMFIAQVYGLELSFAVQFTIVMVALLTSIGVAGIPSASLVAIAVILGTIGLPAEGIALILAVDRILDMFRTTVNVFSDSCGAVIIARLEGETGVLADSEPGK